MNLIGKKILVIHDNQNESNTNLLIFPSVVVGCIPEIGICLAEIGNEENPWLVFHGPLSPLFNNVIWSIEHTLKINNFCLNQIKSGYLSIPLINTFIKNLNGALLGSNEDICPYSM